MISNEKAVIFIFHYYANFLERSKYLPTLVLFSFDFAQWFTEENKNVETTGFYISFSSLDSLIHLNLKIVVLNF